jgi:hypothetical protein
MKGVLNFGCGTLVLSENVVGNITMELDVAALFHVNL